MRGQNDSEYSRTNFVNRVTVTCFKELDGNRFPVTGKTTKIDRIYDNIAEIRTGHFSNVSLEQQPAQWRCINCPVMQNQRRFEKTTVYICRGGSHCNHHQHTLFQIRERPHSGTVKWGDDWWGEQEKNGITDKRKKHALRVSLKTAELEVL